MNYSIFVVAFMFGIVVCKPIDTQLTSNENKNIAETKRFVSQQFPDQFRALGSNEKVEISSSADTPITEQHPRIKRQFPGMGFISPYMQQPYMPFMMPQTFPTFFTVSSQKQKYRQDFFGNMGKSSNFFMSFGR